MHLFLKNSFWPYETSKHPTSVQRWILIATPSTTFQRPTDVITPTSMWRRKTTSWRRRISVCNWQQQTCLHRADIGWKVEYRQRFADIGPIYVLCIKQCIFCAKWNLFAKYMSNSVVCVVMYSLMYYNITKTTFVWAYRPDVGLMS